MSVGRKSQVTAYELTSRRGTGRAGREPRPS